MRTRMSHPYYHGPTLANKGLKEKPPPVQCTGGGYKLSGSDSFFSQIETAAIVVERHRDPACFFALTANDMAGSSADSEIPDVARITQSCSARFCRFFYCLPSNNTNILAGQRFCKMIFIFFLQQDSLPRLSDYSERGYYKTRSTSPEDELCPGI